MGLETVGLEMGWVSSSSPSLALPRGLVTLTLAPFLTPVLAAWAIPRPAGLLAMGAVLFGRVTGVASSALPRGFLGGMVDRCPGSRPKSVASLRARRRCSSDL